jgi:disulfide bond formation protein DsbB
MQTLLLDRPRRTVALFLLVAAIGIFVAAWAFEAAGYIPCKLCLEQRIPYYVGAAVAALALLVEARDGPSILTRLAFLVLIGLFAWGLSVGFYQAGAEWGFWSGPTDCGATRGATIPTNALDLLGSVEKTRIVDCTKAQLRIVGLSFAGWNVIVSLGLIAVAGFGIVAPRRRTA